MWLERLAKGNFLKNEKMRKRKWTMWDLEENDPTGPLGVALLRGVASWSRYGLVRGNVSLRVDFEVSSQTK